MNAKEALLDAQARLLAVRAAIAADATAQASALDAALARLGAAIVALELPDPDPDPEPEPGRDTGPSLRDATAANYPVVLSLEVGSALTSVPERTGAGDSDFPLRLNLAARATLTATLLSGSPGTDLYLHSASEDWSASNILQSTVDLDPKVLIRICDPGNYAIGAFASGGVGGDLSVRATADEAPPAPPPVPKPDTVELVEPGLTTALVSPGGLAAATAAAVPGSVIRIRNGVYTNVDLVLEGHGTWDDDRQTGSPIWVVPETPGGVTFGSGCRIQLAGDGLCLRGFRVTGTALATVPMYHGTQSGTQDAVIVPIGADNRIERIDFVDVGPMVGGGADRAKIGATFTRLTRYGDRFRISFCNFVNVGHRAVNLNTSMLGKQWRMNDCFLYWTGSARSENSPVWAGQNVDGGGGTWKSDSIRTWVETNGFLMERCLLWGDPNSSFYGMGEFKISRALCYDCIIAGNPNQNTRMGFLPRYGRLHEIRRCYFDSFQDCVEMLSHGGVVEDCIMHGGSRFGVLGLFHSAYTDVGTGTHTQPAVDCEFRRLTLLARRSTKDFGANALMIHGTNHGNPVYRTPEQAGFGRHKYIPTIWPSGNTFEQVLLHAVGETCIRFALNQYVGQFLSQNRFVNNRQFGGGQRAEFGQGLPSDPLVFENRTVRPRTRYQNLSFELKVPRAVDGGAGADPDETLRKW